MSPYPAPQTLRSVGEVLTAFAEQQREARGLPALEARIAAVRTKAAVAHDRSALERGDDGKNKKIKNSKFLNFSCIWIIKLMPEMLLFF